MSKVITLKVSPEIKERMKKFRSRVNWSAEIREFIQRRLEDLEREERIGVLAENLKNASWRVPRGFSERSVREDRDGR
ncbi:MAG: CopG family transcriptional regulator [Candidatus Bathyarchaeia archaeon]